MSIDTIRSGQLITTFGPGALLDLPDSAVILGGLDSWQYDNEEIPVIEEPRLLAVLRRQLPNNPPTGFRAPPIQKDSVIPGAFEPNVTAWEFPEWFVVQRSNVINHSVKRRRLVHKNQLTGRRFRNDDGKLESVVPVRFVRSCKKGHIDDIDWKAFVHEQDDVGCLQPMWLEERGSSGALADTWVVCGCGAERSMSAAARDQLHALGFCSGRRPWLGPYSNDSCNLPAKLLIRSASNAYFPQIMSVISIPSTSNDLVELVGRMWGEGLKIVEHSIDLLPRAIASNDKLKFAFESYEASSIKQAVETFIQGDPEDDRAPKDIEFEALTSVISEAGTDKPNGDFYARAMDESKWKNNAPWMEGFDKIVLVHRLREVMAQIGFTRFEAITPSLDGELDMEVEPAPLSRDQTWLPAKENRGEGIFLQFNNDKIDEWMAKEGVVSRASVLEAGFQQKFSEGRDRPFHGAPFYMIHSFSHLILEQITLECGYPTSSIRERIYASKAGYGILIYTGSSDTAGTLGGLIQASNNISDIIRRALVSAELCSNDPICSHEVPNTETQRELLGSACHGCQLTAETSCEWNNSFLDRQLVVKSLNSKNTAFFSKYGF